MYSFLNSSKNNIRSEDSGIGIHLYIYYKKGIFHLNDSTFFPWKIPKVILAPNCRQQCDAMDGEIFVKKIVIFPVKRFEINLVYQLK